MKKIQLSLSASLFILFLLVWTITFSQTQTLPLQKAQITSLTMAVRNAPDMTSSTIVFLRQGDTVEILETKEGYFKVRYVLEGDFPVEGWLPQNSVQVLGETATPIEKPTGQSYIPTEKSEIKEKIEDFPNQPLPEKIQPAPLAGENKNLSPTTPRSSSTPFSKPFFSPTMPAKKIPPGPWQWDLEAKLGWKTLSEKYTTKETASNNYFSSPFLNYELSGLSLDLEATIQRHETDWSWGGYSDYSYSLFSGNIPASNPNVQSTSIQGQFHEFSLGPFLQYEYPFRSGWSFNPVIKIPLQFRYLLLNQLQEISTGQPVLFNLLSYSAGIEFEPRFSGPYDLSLRPNVGIAAFSGFTESPVSTQSTDPALTNGQAQFRTGEPRSSSFLLSYGGMLYWTMRQLNLPDSDLSFGYQYIDISRKYSQFGNRAGISTHDVKTESNLSCFQLGARIRF